MVRKPDWRPPDGDIAPLTAVLAQLHLPELKGTIFKLCFVLWCLSSRGSGFHGSGYTFP